jgi:hypothetical protein
MTREQEDAKIARTVREFTELRKHISMLEDELRGLSHTVESLVYPLRRGETDVILEKFAGLPERVEIMRMAEDLAKGRARREELKQMMKDWGVEM